MFRRTSAPGELLGQATLTFYRTGSVGPGMHFCSTVYTQSFVAALRRTYAIVGEPHSLLGLSKLKYEINSGSAFVFWLLLLPQEGWESRGIEPFGTKNQASPKKPAVPAFKKNLNCFPPVTFWPPRITHVLDPQPMMNPYRIRSFPTVCCVSHRHPFLQKSFAQFFQLTTPSAVVEAGDSAEI